MYTLRRCCVRTLLVIMAALLISFTAEAADDQDDILVGRITHVEGKLLRYVDEGKDWIVTVKDAPFSLEDALYSGENAKAEFILPNRTWLRIGEHTQVQLFALTADATTLDIASGTARLYNKNRDVVCKITTPFGYVVAPGGTVFDLYVGDESMEVIAVLGDVDVIHDATKTRYMVKEGEASLIADHSGMTRGNGMVDSLWDDWNGERDRIWSQRLHNSTSTAAYLPEPIQEESYALEENGRWERVYYEGDYYNMWRPTRVDPGWRPFTVGRWTVYYGDNCWIPDEPFGYLTHHYGSWVYIDSFRTWYWLPPVRRVVVSTPRFLPVFGWYPGRVGWMHHGRSIGWVPLAPDEVYYGYYPWGRRTVVIKRTAVPALSLMRYRYLDEAVIIPRDHFYRGSRYTPYLQRKVDRAVIINTYQPVAVVNNAVISNFDNDPRRFTFNDAKVDRKPHNVVVNRILNNQQLVQNAQPLNRDRITQELKQIAVAEPPAATATRTPLLTSKLVDDQSVAKPLKTGALPKKEIKPKDRQRQLVAVADNAQTVHQPKDRKELRSGHQNEQRRMQASREARNRVMEQSALLATRQANELSPGPSERTESVPAGERPVAPGSLRSGPATTSPPQQGQPSVPPSASQSGEQQVPTVRGRTASPDPSAGELSREQGIQVPQAAPVLEPRQRQRTTQPREEQPERVRQQPVDQSVTPQTAPEAQQRIRSPRELPSQQRQQSGDGIRVEQDNRRPMPRDRATTDQPEPTPGDQRGQRRPRSLRDMPAQEIEQQQPDLQRQQVEQQRRQQQDTMQRQQEEQQRRQQQEIMQRQQEEQQRRQQQEIMQRQQEEQQRRQQQEIMQRQQEEQQRRQQQEMIRRQQEEQQRRQPLQQQQRKRTPQEEELLQQGQPFSR